jgi:hypothetical protein
MDPIMTYSVALLLLHSLRTAEQYRLRAVWKDLGLSKLCKDFLANTTINIGQ